MQWKDWRRSVAKLSGDSVYSFFPPLWSKEATDVNNVQRTVVPVGEQYKLQQSLRRQMHSGK